MKEKLKAIFTNNIGWKIAAFLLGIVTFVILLNTQDPMITTVLNVPVEYVNADILLNTQGLVMEDGPTAFPINVSVRTSQAESISPSFFKCVADLTVKDGGDLMSQSIRVNVEQTGGEGIVLDWDYVRNNRYVTVKMDEYITKPFKVEMLWQDDVPELKPERESFEPETVYISGPSRKFSNLTSVKVPMKLSDFAEGGHGGTINRKVSIALYDSNGKALGNMSDFNISDKTVTLTAAIANLKQVSVVPSGIPAGTPDPDYYFDTVSAVNGTVTLYSLSDITAESVVIPLSAAGIDITGLTESKSFDVDIAPYLPEGTYVSDADRYAEILVQLSEFGKKQFTFEHFDFKGANETLHYEVSGTPYISVSAKPEITESLKEESFLPRIDVTDLEIGTHSLKVIITTPQDVKITESELSVEVKISEKTDEPESESESEPESSSEPSSDPAENN